MSEKENILDKRQAPITKSMVGSSINAEIGNLLIKRSSIKGQITKFKNYIDKITKQATLTTVEFAELSLKLGRFDSLSTKFDELQTQIEILNSKDLESEIDERERIEQDIILCTAIANGLIETHNEIKSFEQERKRRASMFEEAQCTLDHGNDTGLRLPQIQIAKFDGSFFRWLEFHDTFTNLIHNNLRIPNIQKFHYLLSYLEGEAKRIVSNIEISSANYLNAWELLCERFNNKKLLLNHHIKSLFNVQQVTRESEDSLRFLVDHITKNLRAISNLGQLIDQWDILLIFILTSKLDNNTLMKWEEHSSTLGDSPTLEQFKSFLLDRAHVLEAMHRHKDTNNTKFQQNIGVASSSRLGGSHTKSFTSVSRNNGGSYKCVVCKQNHKIYDCPSFKSKNIKDKLLDVSQNKLCTNCLRQGHLLSECRMGPCRYCQKRHNSLLHTDSPDSIVNSIEVQKPESVVNFSEQISSQVVLSTALIEVVNPLTMEVVKVRALMDSGSQSSFITKSLRDKLSLNIIPTSINVIGIGNCHADTVTERCVVQLQSRDSINDFKITVSCFVLGTLAGKLPRFPIDLSHLNLPQNIQLADPHFDQPAPIDLLIGADIFWDVLGSELKSLGKHKPKLYNSQFGWLIGGQMNTHSPLQYTHTNTFNKIHSNHTILSQQGLSTESHVDNSSTTHSIHTKMSQQDLCKESHVDKFLPKFWELEELPQRAILSESAKFCEDHFLTNTRRLDTGRFCVRLPLRDSPDCLGDSYTLAKRRLLHLEKRFRKGPILKLQYVQFMREYEVLGHLSKSKVHLPNPSYFLCHHAVFKDSSESTKIRVVFDGSAPSSSGYSVNDLQMVGPNVQDSLFSILIRARQYKYLLTGDVEKMYRQVQVHTGDRNLQLILWREDESQPIKTMQLNTVTYGTASASYLSTRCLKQIGEECDDELIKPTTNSLTMHIYEPIINLQRFSKLSRLKRTFCYVQRFIHNMKYPKDKMTGILTTTELKSSFEHLCFIAQQECFSKEYTILSNNKCLSSKSKILSLSPFVNESDNLIRVGGRIDSSSYPFEKRHPILLVASHYLTKLIFEQEHVSNLHAGPQLLLAIVRETVWPLNGRWLARRTANNCVRCRRALGKTLCPKMGDLPLQRVVPDFPFNSVGMDYAGPFLVLNRKGRGAKVSKCYLCIFVCLRYKCLHLEVVSDLSKDAFIMTLRRFIARRGKPAELFSDNGRNFVAAAKELSTFLKIHVESLSEFAAQEGIRFIFTPSYAPHFGGIWEAGVKSAKFHVKRVIGNSHVTFEELTTLFAQVECILNSRPLCPLSSSPHDYQYLSPGHFLIGRQLNALPAPTLEAQRQSSLNRYARLEQIRQHFWRRWQREYISELQLRTKWKQTTRTLNIGDLVLLHEEALPPLCWRVGRVTKLFPGPDNISRVAEVTTSKGVYRRPFVRLCPLLPEE